MKQILLATVASLALSLPAVAQNNMPQDSQSQPQQTQMNQQNSGASGYGNNQRQALGSQQQRIDPSQLSKSEISQIQKALNEKGFDADNVDGVWGPETNTALQNFQQQNNLTGSGELNQETLSELGVNIASQGQQGTVGAGPSDSGSMGSGSTETQGLDSDRNGMSPNSLGTSGGDSPSGQSGSTDNPQQ